MNNEGFLIYEFQIFFHSKIFPARMNSLINPKSIDFKGKRDQDSPWACMNVCSSISETPKFPIGTGLVGHRIAKNFQSIASSISESSSNSFFAAPYTKSQLGLHGRVDIFCKVRFFVYSSDLVLYPSVVLLV